MLSELLRTFLALFNFYGHNVLAMIADVGLAASTVHFTVMFAARWGRIELPFWKRLLYGWWTLTIFPSATYAFLELRHILVVDGVADTRPWQAMIAFSTVSIIGLACAVHASIYAVEHLPFLAKHPLAAIVVLSILQGVGAVLGYLDLLAPSGFLFPPIVFYYLAKIASNQGLMILAVSLATIVCVTTFAAYGIHKLLIVKHRVVRQA